METQMKSAWFNWENMKVMTKRKNHPSYDRIIFYLHSRGKTNILDCGVISAVMYQKIKKQKVWCDYMGMDINYMVLNQNEKRYKETGWVHGDIEDMPFSDNKYEVVIARHVIEHLSGYKKAIDEMHRVSNSKVIICLSHVLEDETILDSKHKYGGIYHHNQYGKEFKEYLDSKFDYVHSEIVSDEKPNHLFICKK